MYQKEELITLQICRITAANSQQRYLEDDNGRPSLSEPPVMVDESDVQPIPETDMVKNKRLVHGMNAVPFVRAFQNHLITLNPATLASVKRFNGNGGDGNANLIAPLGSLFNGARGFGKRAYAGGGEFDDDAFFEKRNLFKLKSLGARGFGRR